MVHLIVSGHGEIAQGLKSSLSLIAGDFEHVHFIDFVNNQEQLRADFENVINQNPQGEFLILVDLFGGTPFKTATLLANEKSNVRVVSGVNLPMLISIVFDTASNLNDLTNAARNAGKEGIQ